MTQTEQISNGSSATTKLAARTIDAVKVFGQGDNSVRALDGLSIELKAGEFTAVMGPSGSGKSTLLHCLAALDTLTSGAVELGGTDLSTLSEKELTLFRRKQLGFIFQSFNLVPTLNLIENVSLPLQLAGKKPDPDRLAEVLNTLGLSDRTTHRPSELSGGQQQRTAAARAFVSNPALVFADEPTGNLDRASGIELLTFMRKAVDDSGQSIAMVTHDAHAASFADRVVFLVDGKAIDEITAPTTDLVLDRLKSLGA